MILSLPCETQILPLTKFETQSKRIIS